MPFGCVSKRASCWRGSVGCGSERLLKLHATFVLAVAQSAEALNVC